MTLGNDGHFYGTALGQTQGTVFQVTPQGVLATLYSFAGGDGSFPYGTLTPTSNGRFVGATPEGPEGINSNGTLFELTITPPPAFFTGEASLDEDVYYLQFSNGDFFGYYSFRSDPSYLYHFDLGLRVRLQRQRRSERRVPL